MELGPTGSIKTMPSLANGTHAYRHSVDSALVSLAAIGVQAQRIQLRRGGRQGASAGTVVRQNPPAGTPLNGSTLVELEIAGLGFSHALPVGMWDSGGEAAAGTREILEGFDDPLEKLKHWFHEGAPLFRIAPDDPQANLRWLALFGVDAAQWPRRLWFRLASLIARMGQLSCSQTGSAFVLQVLLGLPVLQFRYRPSETDLPPDALSRLGAQSSQLGINLLMGSRVEELATLVLEFGPVDLATYERFTADPEGAALLAQTLRLVMPCTTPYEIVWAVLDKERAPRLGVAEENARLGINTHLGGSLGGGHRLAPAVIGHAASADPEDISLQLAEITKEIL